MRVLPNLFMKFVFLVYWRNILSVKNLSWFSNETFQGVQHTPQLLYYNMVHYNTVLDITRVSAGPQMIISD